MFSDGIEKESTGNKWVKLVNGCRNLIDERFSVLVIRHRDSALRGNEMDFAKE